MKNKNNGWMKGLGKSLVKGILELEPESVTFMVVRPDLVRCEIKLKEGEAVGVAICSVLDKFDERFGKSKSAGRALEAAIRREHSGLIRKGWHQFSGSWTKRQIDRVIKVGFLDSFKSKFVEVL